MRVPKYDWNKEDFDSYAEYIVNLSDLDAESANREIVALSDLPPGTVWDENDSWQDDFEKGATYPPIVVQRITGKELAVNDIGCGSVLVIVNGNHRIIMWRKWGFTHVPAFVFTED